LLLDVINKNFKELIRHKITFGLIIIFPIFFLFIFSLAFGGADLTSTSTYNIAILNLDEGIPESMAVPQLPQNWRDDGVGQNLSDILFDVKYNESENSEFIFNEIIIDQSQINQSLDDNVVTLVLIIPENFSQVVLNKINNAAGLTIQIFPTNINETFTIIGDDRSYGFIISESIIKSIISGFLESIEQGDNYSSGQVFINQETVLPETELDVFDFIAAGLFSFATILSAAVFVSFLISDEETGSMNRIKLSLINPWTYMMSYTIVIMILSAIQTITLFITAYYIFDFHPAGSFVNAFIVMMILAMAILGLSFSGAALFKTSDTAGTAIGTSSSILGFASGTFFAMPKIVLIKDALPFTSGSSDFLIWDILPWTHAVNALRAILIFDQSLTDVMGDIALLFIMGFIWMILGMYFYTKKRFKVEGGN
jgi:ABC-2 type transport system permease protein